MYAKVQTMRQVLVMTCAAMVACISGGCRRIAISGDFEAPFEREGILMPQSTRSYVLASPPGSRLTVDVGIDFEESELKADRMALTVGTGEGLRQGEHVPGSQTRRIVCGVPLTDRGVPVDVKNLNALSSARFSLRVWKSPRLCQSRRYVPSSVLVQRPGRAAPRHF
jgi:hypothetical protein